MRSKADNLRRRALQLAEAEEFRPDNQLEQIRAKTHAIHVMFNRLLEPLAVEGHEFSLGDVQRVRVMLESWIKLLELADKKLDEMQRRHLELHLRPEAQHRYEHWKDSLREQYEGKGPQYDILVESIARIHVYLEEMFASGRMYSLAELQELGQLELQYVEQLQSRTETTKVEVIEREINLKVVAVLEIGERYMKDVAPQQWQEFIQELGTMTGAERALVPA